MNGITIVAEVACAHEGNLDSLFEMIEVAGRVQVDAIQFQFFQAGENAIEGQPNYDIAVQLELPLEAYSEIFRRSRAHSLKVWATVGDVVSAEEANKYSPEVWRIHSGDINNITLIEYLCETNIPIVFSVGGSTLEEIEYAINYTREHGGEVHALIHGFQGYPTPIDEVNLSFIKTLKNRFNIAVGYQDHTDGDDSLGFIIPAMAICYGARIIEKHFTLDRSKRGIDYQASLNPDEFEVFVSQMRRLYPAAGCVGRRVFGAAEEMYRKRFKKGLVFRRGLYAGSKVAYSDLKMVRVEDIKVFGNEIETVAGKALKTEVSKNQMVEWDLFE